jgi:hypothetical protein
MTKKIDKKEPSSSKKLGRPTLYTEALAQEICEVVATHPNGLTTLCNERPHWPHVANVYIWLRKYQSFRDSYTKAKEEQVEVSVDLMQTMMDEDHHFKDAEGNTRVDVGMLRVKVDAIKWQAGKLKPKKYGDSKNEEINKEIDADVFARKHALDEKNKKEY